MNGLGVVMSDRFLVLREAVEQTVGLCHRKGLNLLAGLSLRMLFAGIKLQANGLALSKCLIVMVHVVFRVVLLLMVSLEKHGLLWWCRI